MPHSCGANVAQRHMSQAVCTTTRSELANTAYRTCGRADGGVLADGAHAQQRLVAGVVLEHAGRPPVALRGTLYSKQKVYGKREKDIRAYAHNEAEVYVTSTVAAYTKSRSGSALKHT
jgi:hypothetical protein